MTLKTTNNNLPHIFYPFDFIFGILTWGITRDKLKKLKTEQASDLTNVVLDPTEASISITADAHDKLLYDVVIIVCVITMVAVVMIMSLRTMQVLEAMFYPEVVEFTFFGLMTVIGISVAMVVVAVMNCICRNFGKVRTGVAGGWDCLLAGITRAFHWLCPHDPMRGPLP